MLAHEEYQNINPNDNSLSATPSSGKIVKRLTFSAAGCVPALWSLHIALEGHGI